MLMNTNEVERAVALLTDREVSVALKVSRAALRFWRAHGGGPPWIRLEKRLVRYPSDKLREWIERQAEAR